VSGGGGARGGPGGGWGAKAHRGDGHGPAPIGARNDLVSSIRRRRGAD
jgi:hypothetical protein